MPNNSIDRALIRQFSDMFHITAQQTQSLFADAVTTKALTGDDMAYDTFGSLYASKTEGRNQPIVFKDQDYNRRQLKRERWTLPTPIDAYDLAGMMTDPNSAIMSSMIAEMNRVRDAVIAKACFANVRTGRDFENEVTFDEDGGITVDAQAGLTYEKLLEISRNFKSKSVELSDVCLAITDEEEERLMKEDKLTSRDFITTYPVEGGMIRRVLGMRLVVFPSATPSPILNVQGGIRNCIAIAKTPKHSGVLLGISKGLNIKAQERPDLLDTTQIVAGLWLGAMRTEGVLVQKIQTTPII